MKNLTKLIILLFILGMGVVLYNRFFREPAVDLTEVNNSTETEPILIVEMMIGNLEDVTGGKASGKAVATYENGEYRLSVKFTDLPELDEGYFYEGWIVRRGSNQSVLSTGKVVNNMNIFTSETDLTDHNFYVLTLEPDDGNPAPAEHILEGTLGY